MSRERQLLSTIIDMLERSELSGLEYAILDGETVCANDLINAANKELAKPEPEPLGYVHHEMFAGFVKEPGYASMSCVKLHYPDSGYTVPVYAEPTARNYWKEFTYKEALCGIYWVCGTYPEYDIDVDYVGRDILVTTGEMCQFVSLVYIDFNPEDPAAMMVDAIDCHNIGTFSDEHLISHYMEFEIPKHPDEDGDKQ